MERPDRAPNGMNSQSAGRGGLPENPAQGRRPVPNSAATSNGPTPLPPPPVPTLRKAPSSSTLSASNLMPPSQVINLAREAMRNALESETQAAEANAAGAGLKTGVTVDLSRKNIQKLPEEVVDILKNELERWVSSTSRLKVPCMTDNSDSLALSHNQLSSLPVRFSECTSLRYLNIRGNQIKEFPMTVYDPSYTSPCCSSDVH